MSVDRKPNGKWNFWCQKCGHLDTNLPNKATAEGKQAGHKRKGCDK